MRELVPFLNEIANSQSDLESHLNFEQMQRENNFIYINIKAGTSNRIID